MSAIDTKQKILDCAEKLFALHGFRGTSLRRITAAADVNLAAVHYHFGSKDGLIEAVFERRMEPLNEERMERLQHVSLIGRALIEPDERLRQMFFRLVSPLFLLLLDMMCEALPHLDRQVLFWRLNFALGAMGRYLCLAEPLQSVAGDMVGEVSGAQRSDLLIDFILHGIAAS
jgi:AcrR family transcriptional regulator